MFIASNFYGMNKSSVLTYTWTSLANATDSRREPALFTLNGKLYSKGGFTTGVVATTLQYDPVGNSWSSKASGFTGRGSGAFTVGTMSYVFGGFNTNYLDTNQAYDDVSNVWINKTVFPLAIYNPFGFSYGGYGYGGGGNNGTYPNGSPKFYRYDPSANSWTAMTDMPGGTYQAYTFVIGDYAYVCCGITSAEIKKVYRYSFAGNSWTTMSDFPGTARRYGLGFSLNGRGYIFGGQNGTTYYDDLWEYNPNTDTWSEKTSAPISRSALSGGSIDTINNKFYFTQGWDGISNKNNTYSLEIN